MKLAEALLERKSLMEKVQQLRDRLTQNVLVQEGDAPTESPQEMMGELDGSITQLETLIKQINGTNNVALLPDGTTVSNAIVQRDMLKLRRETLDLVANTAGVRQNRYTRNEVKFVVTVSAPDLRKQVDALAKSYRELDAQIQAVNWNTELAE